MRALLILSVLVAGSASAQIYSWEDKDGVHYTDDPTAVPKRVQATKEALQTPPSPTSAPVFARAPATVGTELSPRERDWRDRFIEAHRRLQLRKQELTALEASLPQKVQCTQVQQVVAQAAPNQGRVDQRAQVVSQCSPNPMYDRIRLQMEQKQVELREAELDLEQLDRRASMEAVPREWRRGW